MQKKQSSKAKKSSLRPRGTHSNGSTTEVLRKRKPRILIVTPEITYLPAGMGNMANHLTAKAGGLADVSASLVASLFELGADVHVALPHYRKMFHVDVGRLISDELRVYKSRLADSRIHLAEDRCFYYRDTVYSNDQAVNPHLALAFQREVINNIIPQVQPDLIHCNDWMTGLIPAAARRMGIPSLFTIHNIHTYNMTLAQIEESGIDAAEFWRYLYFSGMPYNYESTRNSIPVDMLTSGVFAAHFINTVSPTFLKEITNGWFDFIPQNFRNEVINKYRAGCASGILNAPDESYNPVADEALYRRYDATNHVEMKRENKLRFQHETGLVENPDAPLFFWPSRLDPVQKGPQLLADILYRVLERYRNENLQIAIVANGAYKQVFYDIFNFHGLAGRLAICDFDEKLSRRGFAASDFTLVPSLFEPCGLPQMVGPKYGSLPVVHDTGGLHDTVEMMNVEGNCGNGFGFNVYNSESLLWAMDQAMNFYRRDPAIRAEQVARVMREASARFTHEVCAQSYIDIYENMLHIPLVR